MKVAVLGAGGFIGSRVVEILHLSAIADVRPIVRRLDGLATTARFNLDFRIADGTDQSALTLAFSGCDAIVHAIAGDRETILGTLTPVYRAAEAAGVKRLVYLSSASVHGQSPLPGTDENTPLSDRQPLEYNTSKVRAERGLLALRKQGQVELVLLRPGIVFGPRSFWTRQFAADLIRGSASLINQGRGVCNSAYVDNVVHAIYQALIVPEADGEIFLIGDNEKITWAEFYQPITDAFGIDIADVPAAAPATVKKHWTDRLETVLASKPSLAVLSRFPDRWRRAARAALDVALEAPPPTLDPPVASLETTLLQQCNYKLPNTKARHILHYAPPVDFAEASQRTVGWLQFAGFPVRR